MNEAESRDGGAAATAQALRLILGDVVERIFLLLLLGFFLYRLIPSLGAEPHNTLLLVSEAFTVLLVLLRSEGSIATTGYAWAVAIIGTCAPLLAIPDGTAIAPIWLGTVLMSWGLALSLSAKIFLNRSFGIVAANRGVKHAGPYRLVRHPMYLGYIGIHVGFLLLHFSVWNTAVYASCWFVLILRIRAEEDFLSLDEQYRNYADRVKYRLVPGFY